MTDAEKYVRETWPRADCFETVLYWPGQGEKKRFIVIRSPVWSGVDGSGLTEIAAWASAANMIEQRNKIGKPVKPIVYEYREIRPGVYESGTPPRKVDNARVSEILDMRDKKGT